MRVVIVGAGKLGLAITEALLGGGNEITLIDKDAERIAAASNQYDVFTICADAKRTEVLKGLPIVDQHLLIAATGSDETNMVIASFAKKLGCKTVMARVREPEHVDQKSFIKDSLGIDHLLNPDMACAGEIFKYLTEKHAIGRGEFNLGEVSILEFAIEKMEQMVGQELKDAATKLDGLLIAAISRDGKIMIPNGSTKFEAEDVLYVIGETETVDKLARKVKEGDKENDKEGETKVNRVMIAGGGNTGYFLSKLLSEKNIGVKLVEKDRKRAEQLSGMLDDVLVLNADATEPGLLQEENLDSMDAFVALTGFDEENLLLSLIAKDAGVEEVVTKISRKSYSFLTEKIGVAMTINPMDMCANSVLHNIRKEGVVLFNKLINGQAEFVEIVAQNGMPLIDKPLMNLEIPKGILIAAINRNGSVIIPRGNTQIMPGDRVTIISLLANSASLEGLLSKGKTSKL